MRCEYLLVAAPVTFGGVPYLRFTTEQPLAPVAVRHLSNVSSAYVLFHLEGEVAARLDEAGLSLAATPGYGAFTHWVDQGITRDLLVAREPG